MSDQERLNQTRRLIGLAERGSFAAEEGRVLLMEIEKRDLALRRIAIMAKSWAVDWQDHAEDFAEFVRIAEEAMGVEAR